MTIGKYHVSGWAFLAVFLILGNLFFAFSANNAFVWINWIAAIVNIVGLGVNWDEWVYREYYHDV